MGYDVTFHPVSLDEIRRYVFEVIAEPGLADARADEITSDPAKRRHIERVYIQLADWVQKLSEGQSLPLNETIAYAAAQIAGFLHPYWYARNASISMLEDDGVRDLFMPLTQLANAPASIREAGTAAHIGLNQTASGVITDLDQLEANLKKLGLENHNGSPALFSIFDAIALASLREAIAYCRQHDLALIEAADVVVPIADAAGTDPDNYREPERFDESSPGHRQWYEPPQQERPPAFEALQASKAPVANDAVMVRRLLRRNRLGTLVPLYLVPNLDRRKYSHPTYKAVLYEDGQVVPVHRRRLKVVERASLHREYRRRLFEHERSFYEEQAESHPGPRIESAAMGIGDIAQDILGDGLTAAAVEEWTIADKLFSKALSATEIIIGDKHAERDSFSYPGNLANVLRTRWFARALLGQAPDPEALIEACEIHGQFARDLKRSQWDEYRQRDYVDFVLTSLVTERPDLAVQMLGFKRPFDDQLELMALYRAIADPNGGAAGSQVTLEKSMQLLEVMRHPQGGKFLQHGALTAIQLALVTNHYLSAEPQWRSIREIAAWLGR